MSKQPIGFFDSGVGGTSIWKELHKRLPNESTIYLADSKHAPYGSKGKSCIIDLSIKNTEYLLSKGCKLIVVACNTATTNAISVLRLKFNVPFIGIEPAIKPAALNTKTRAIGILATQGTLSSELFHKTTLQHTKNIKVIEQVGEGIVQAIEKGHLHKPYLKALLVSYLKPIIAHNCDYLVLGCTHYPYLIPLLKSLLPSHIKIIDSGEAVAKQTEFVLKSHRLLTSLDSTVTCQFYSNGDARVMNTLLDSSFKAEYLDF